MRFDMFFFCQEIGYDISKVIRELLTPDFSFSLLIPPPFFEKKYVFHFWIKNMSEIV